MSTGAKRPAQGSMQLPFAVNAEAVFFENAPRSGLLATNHQNLLFMLAAGLVLPPSGFRGKHYRDSLGAFPGWVPLFVKQAFGAAIKEATAEADYLQPCLVRVALCDLSGPVLALRAGAVCQIDFPSGTDGNEDVILVPAPIPTRWIQEVLFPSKESKAACESAAQHYGNVPLRDFKRKVLKRPFKEAKESLWPPPVEIPAKQARLSEPLSAGGVMAMLFQVGNRGDLAVEACRAAFNPDAASEAVSRDALLAGLPRWLGSGYVAESEQLSPDVTGVAEARASQRRLFWSIVARLAQGSAGLAASSPEEVVLQHLEDESGSLHEKVRGKVLEFKQALEDLGGFGGLGPEDVFQRFPSPFSRSMALLFLRKDCAELLEFESDLLNEQDWLAAAILFGARCGWQALPLNLRDMPGLGEAVSQRMAALAHRMADTGISLGPNGPWCRPLRALFRHEAEWPASHRAVAAELAQKLAWDCIRTEVELGTGQYALVVDRGKVKIVVQGRSSAVTESVDRDQFFKHLAKARIPKKVEMDLRKRLGATRSKP